MGRGSRGPSGHIPFTPRAKKVPSYPCVKHCNRHITSAPAHPARADPGREGVAAQVLVRLGADSTACASRSSSCPRLQGKEPLQLAPHRRASSTSLVLDQSGRNPTAAAREGSSTVIGREKEVERVMQVQPRRTKNNPVLVGEPGVGKTAVVEGLAQRIVKGEVPETLGRQAALHPDLGALVPTSHAAISKSAEEGAQRDPWPAATSSCSSMNPHAGWRSRGGRHRRPDTADASPRRAADDGATTLDEYRKHLRRTRRSSAGSSPSRSPVPRSLTRRDHGTARPVRSTSPGLITDDARGRARDG
jgi:hypothetical protein